MILLLFCSVSLKLTCSLPHYSGLIDGRQVIFDTCIQTKIVIDFCVTLSRGIFIFKEAKY